MTESRPHTMKVFDEELDSLRATVSQIGGLAEMGFREAMRCLVYNDLEGAARIVADDRRIDALEASVEQQALEMIALRAPMADDLRDLVAALKIAGLIERIGDYAKNIAKRVPQFNGFEEGQPAALLQEMAQTASWLVQSSLDAFVRRDPEAARLVCEGDKTVDVFYNSMFRALLAYMAEHPGNLGPTVHLLFIAKNIERVGDHATNIAEMVYFAATGERLEERVRGPDPTLSE